MITLKEEQTHGEGGREGGAFNAALYTTIDYSDMTGSMISPSTGSLLTSTASAVSAASAILAVSAASAGAPEEEEFSFRGPKGLWQCLQRQFLQAIPLV